MKPVGRRDTLVEVGVAGAGGEGPLQRVEHGQDGQQRCPPAVPAGGVPLLRDPPLEICKVRAQAGMVLRLLVEHPPQAFDLPRLSGVHALSWPCARQCR